MGTIPGESVTGQMCLLLRDFARIFKRSTYLGILETLLDFGGKNVVFVFVMPMNVGEMSLKDRLNGLDLPLLEGSLALDSHERFQERGHFGSKGIVRQCPSTLFWFVVPERFLVRKILVVHLVSRKIERGHGAEGVDD